MKNKISRWFPAVLVMAIIFGASSIPSPEMPRFDWADAIIKKGGHMIGYGLLALAYLRAVGQSKFRPTVLAWILTVLYACTDEFHQSFVPGRGASIWDVVLFDSTGAALALWIKSFQHKFES
jgi:VanZ family protein